jgi:hypothetical protein
MSAPTAMDEDKGVIIVNPIRPERSGDVCQVRRSLVRLARGLGTGALPCLPSSSHWRVSHTAPVLFCVFFFIFDGATWAKGSALAPSGTSADSCIHDSVRYFSEAVMALAWSLRRGYYHIGCTRESYWPTNRSSCPCINLIESVVNCTAIRCAPITSPSPLLVIDSYPSRYDLLLRHAFIKPCNREWGYLLREVTRSPCGDACRRPGCKLQWNYIASCTGGDAHDI